MSQARLDEVAQIFAEQGANRFRVQAYRNAANVIRRLLSIRSRRSSTEDGIEGLEENRGVGPSIARAIRDILLHRRLAMLDRFRGESDPVVVLASVPGVGKRLARRFHDELGIETLEELKWRLTMAESKSIRASVRSVWPESAIPSRNGSVAFVEHQPRRRSRVRRPSQNCSMSIASIVRKLRLVTLKKIAPRRFNPEGENWLPILHTARDGRHYTALFSNTAHAHELTKRDWVVLFWITATPSIASRSSLPSSAGYRVSASSPAAKTSVKNITIAPPPRFVRRFYENVS